MRKLNWALMVAVGVTCSASAAPIEPVRHLDNYVCMAIDAPESVMMDFQHPLSLMASPSPTSAVLSGTTAIVAVDPRVPEQNGFRQVINFAFKPGWLEAKYLKPYSQMHPGVGCVPSVMNTGKLGFDFSNSHPNRQ